MAECLGFFLAPAGGFNLAGFHAIDRQCLGNSIRTLLTERKVVFGTATFIGISFDADLQGRILGQESAVHFDHHSKVLLDGVIVKVEEHGTLLAQCVGWVQIGGKLLGLRLIAGCRLRIGSGNRGYGGFSNRCRSG